MISPLLVICKLCLQKIGKEKQFQDTEHDKELDQNDFPEGFAHCHLSEAIPIKIVHPHREMSRHRVPSMQTAFSARRSKVAPLFLPENKSPAYSFQPI
jgi:hypothetical protein